MSHFPKLSAAKFVAFQTIDAAPEPIRIGYMIRMFRLGGQMGGSRLQNIDLCLALIRKILKELTELDQAYRLPPEDLDRRLKIAIEVSDVRDWLAFLRQQLGQQAVTARASNLQRYSTEDAWHHMLTSVTLDGLSSATLRQLSNAIATTYRTVNRFTRQEDVLLTPTELNHAASLRNMATDACSPWCVRQFIVPRTATEVIAAFKPDKWQEIQLHEVDKSALITLESLYPPQPVILPQGNTGKRKLQQAQMAPQPSRAGYVLGRNRITGKTVPVALPLAVTPTG